MSIYIGWDLLEEKRRVTCIHSTSDSTHFENTFHLIEHLKRDRGHLSYACGVPTWKKKKKAPQAKKIRAVSGLLKEIFAKMQTTNVVPEDHIIGTNQTVSPFSITLTHL